VPETTHISEAIREDIHIIPTGASYTLEKEIKNEKVTSRIISVVTESEDLNFKFHEELIEYQQFLECHLSFIAVRISEIEKIKRKLNALKFASGTLNDLTAEQKALFEESIQRRPLFK